MNTKYAFVPLVLATVAFACFGVQMIPSGSAIQEAHRAYYCGEYARSVALYERLAATGNAEAAERAAFMRLEGSTLYGPHVERDVAKAEALLVQAARSRRPAAVFLLNMLNNTD